MFRHIIQLSLHSTNLLSFACTRYSLELFFYSQEYVKSTAYKGKKYVRSIMWALTRNYSITCLLLARDKYVLLHLSIRRLLVIISRFRRSFCRLRRIANGMNKNSIATSRKSIFSHVGVNYKSRVCIHE